jgi:ribosomal protein S18 acetylase RimI-like enzyme
MMRVRPEDDESGIVGMVTARGRRDHLEIARLYVHPESQRRGAGTRLLAAARDAFPDLGRVRLEVEAQNPKGRAFYAKLGYAEVGS